MTWQQILGLGVIAALVTAASNFFSTWWFASLPKKEMVRYYAMRISLSLDQFAFDCADLISDESTFHASGGTAGAAFWELPVLQISPDIEWKALKISLVQRVLAMQNDIQRSNGLIKGESSHLTSGDTAIEPAEQAGLIGYRAVILAGDIRKEYAPGASRQVLHPWDYVALLKEKHDKKIAEYKTWPAGD